MGDPLHSRPLTLWLIFTCALHAASLRPGSLRCEARENPLAIEAAEPRLSWIVEAVDPNLGGLRQSAYRILAASSPARLAQNRGDLWDTGKVESGQTIQIPYAGSAVAPQSFAYWKVQVWDQENQPSPWSAVADWRRGLAPEDWKARWIAAPPLVPPAARRGTGHSLHLRPGPIRGDHQRPQGERRPPDARMDQLS
jgi:alpha-L-rhamnosidase